jgi:hypothetical protein
MRERLARFPLLECGQSFVLASSPVATLQNVRPRRYPRLYGLIGNLPKNMNTAERPPTRQTVPIQIPRATDWLLNLRLKRSLVIFLAQLLLALANSPAQPPPKIPPRRRMAPETGFTRWRGHSAWPPLQEIPCGLPEKRQPFPKLQERIGHETVSLGGRCGWRALFGESVEA